MKNKKVGIEYYNIGNYLVAYTDYLPKRKLPIYVICQKDNEFIHMGIVKYYGPWRKYIWDTDGIFDNIIFDSKCLRAMADFVDYINKEYKEGRIEVNRYV